MDEKKLIAIIKKLMPSVVSIMISKHLADVEKDMAHQFYSFFPGMHRVPQKKFKIPDFMVDSRGMVQVGGGSGFVVDQNGLVLTNKHVISDPQAEYTVTMNDGRKFPAQILTRDPINDVAILKIQATALPAVFMGDAAKLELGQNVVAIGNALGIFKNTVSQGIVSGLSRSISAKADPKSAPQEMRGLIQTDAAINPGNSGGPLVTSDGLAIGINSAIVFGAQNIGFAIPINAARRDLDDLNKFGRIRRPLLGVRYIVLDENLQHKMKLPVDYGAYIVNETPHDHGVVPGSPADKAGLKEKDIVLEVNDAKVDRDHPIQDYLEDMSVGDVMNLLVLRGDKKLNVRVVLAERK